jgi:pimeloyl-ACP methyl ester carboxylesterase
MGRGWKIGRRAKIGIAAAVAILVLLGVNALLVGGETEEAEATTPEGTVVDTRSGNVQVVERGPLGSPPIVLLHCFSCASDWWDGVTPRLARDHRVIAIDLLGHGGSEKPDSGYTIEHQAETVARVLWARRVHDATVIGHSLGGSVAVGLAERSPDLVDRVAIIDMPPDNSYGDLGFIAGLAFQPVLGEALWRIKPDFSVRDGLEVAFAPGFDVPDAFVEDVKRLTYSAYDESPSGNEDYLDEESLDKRARATGKPLLVLMGAEEQIVDDPQRALDQYHATVPGAKTFLVPGAGHSPNVEKPAETARLILAFADDAGNRPQSPGRGNSVGSP